MEGGDTGKPSSEDENSQVAKAFKELAENLIRQIDERNKNLDPTKRVEIKHK
jgi:ATP-binding protein involved in chromosome partitioning